VATEEVEDEEIEETEEIEVIEEIEEMEEIEDIEEIEVIEEPPEDIINTVIMKKTSKMITEEVEDISDLKV